MNVEQFVDSISRQVHQAGQAIEDKMNGKDISNPESMLKAQFALMQYTNMINCESAMIKNIKDIISGIITRL